MWIIHIGIACAVLWASASAQITPDRHLFHECLKQSLERAEEAANVIFTGTIRDLYKDWQHPDMLKANVEVKRVMKGTNVINTIPTVDTPNSLPWGRKTVVVDGIGDPGICESFARKYDTRIFLLIKGENGELKLNSSLVRLTLNNIIRADAAVQGIFFSRLLGRVMGVATRELLNPSNLVDSHYTTL